MWLLAQTNAASGGVNWALVIIGIVVLLFVGLVIAAFRARARNRLPEQPKLQKQESPQLVTTQKEPEIVAPKVTLAPSAAEEKARDEERKAKEEAQRLQREQQRLKDAAAADEGQRAALEAEALKLREQSEEAKKDAYRAHKAAEAEEKERKKKEREESDRLIAEEKKRVELEKEQAEEAKREAERQKVAAEAGRTLAAGLSKTKSEGFIARLNGLFGGGTRTIDESVLAELEEVLFTADIGVKTASRLVELARDKARSKQLGSADLMKSVIRDEVQKIVDLPASHALSGSSKPYVIMVVGVNGAGKTTTIGKLAAQAKAKGKRVMLAAGDTFRAAAAEQLDVWADRAGAELIKGKEDADPASVVFDAAKKAQEAGVDLLIADTAGRLHTKTNLMEELKKVKRVLGKATPGAPHEVLLVLDSTNGQNAIAQAREFHDAVGITSIALTKLDGTAKGGVIIGICDELKVPVAWAGVGEKVNDLRPFEPKEFVSALFD